MDDKKPDESAPRKGMLLNLPNLELAALASDDDSRLNLAGVYVTPDCTVATDGMCLGIVDTPRMDAADFPNVGVEVSEDALKPCIIPRDAAVRIGKSIPKRQRIPILQNALVDVAASNANGTFRAIMTDTETTTPIEVRKVDGSFPDYSVALPGGEPMLRISFNVKLLRKVLAVAEKCKGSSRPFFTFEFFGDSAPVKITGTNEDTGQRLTFVVMPARL